MFGVECTSRSSIASRMSVLTNPEEWGNYVFGFSTSPGRDISSEMKIVSGHAYAMQPFAAETGETLYRVTNPWSTAESHIMTLYDIMNLFSDVYVGKVA